jgi:hypothetical protein
MMVCRMLLRVAVLRPFLLRAGGLLVVVVGSEACARQYHYALGPDVWAVDKTNFEYLRSLPAIDIEGLPAEQIRACGAPSPDRDVTHLVGCNTHMTTAFDLSRQATQLRSACATLQRAVMTAPGDVLLHQQASAKFILTPYTHQVCEAADRFKIGSSSKVGVRDFARLHAALARFGCDGLGPRRAGGGPDERLADACRPDQAGGPWRLPAPMDKLDELAHRALDNPAGCPQSPPPLLRFS